LNITDIAKFSIEKAENEFLFYENNSSNLTILLPKNKEGEE